MHFLAPQVDLHPLMAASSTTKHYTGAWDNHLPQADSHQVCLPQWIFLLSKSCSRVISTDSTVYSQSQSLDEFDVF